MLPSLAALSVAPATEGKRKERSPSTRVVLEVEETSDRLVVDHEELNLATVTACEMTVAKVVLDALVSEMRDSTDPDAFVRELRSDHKEYLKPIARAIVTFRAELEKRRSESTLLMRWHKMANLVRMRFDPESASLYRQFLMDYASERDISLTMLQGVASMESEDDEDDDQPGGTDFSFGVHRVLVEYFQRPDNYSVNEKWTSQLTAYARNSRGQRVAVGLINLSTRHEPLYDSRRSTMRIQGIIGCPIFRLFFHAPIGGAFLATIERIARELDRVVLVSPLGKGVTMWAEKLAKAAFVRVDSKWPPLESNRWAVGGLV